MTTTSDRLYRALPCGKAEDAESYRKGGFHPLHLGDLLKDGRYRIVHKLGFGDVSTVWLARDNVRKRYVAIKVAMAQYHADSQELKVLQHLATQGDKHVGSRYVARLYDDFVIDGPNGMHQCLVTQPAGGRLVRPAGTTYAHLGLARLLASQLFQAVDYLHSSNVGHGDLYPGNVIMQLDNFDSWSDEEVYECLGEPVLKPLYRIDGKPVGNCAPAYTVQPGDMAKSEGRLLLSKLLIIDFGQAYFLDDPPICTTSPSQFRAPENILRQSISSASDVWALGSITFEICAGYTLFKALFLPRQDVLRDVVAMSGRLPHDLWDAWAERQRYFDDDGNAIKLSGHSILTEPYSLYARIRDMAFLDRANRHDHDRTARGDLQTSELVQMHDFLTRVFALQPESRISTHDALEHPFLRLH